MSKPSWLIISPASGSGNSTISNSAAAHTGRVARTGTVTVSAVGVSDVTYDVTQSPLAEFAAFDNGASMAASKSGGTVTVTGTSNSSKLTFSWGDGTSDVSIPSTYTANGSSADNGTAISGDPGAVSQFAFSIALTFPANETISDITRQLVVTPNSGSGDAAAITITQAAGDPTLSVSPASITIPQAGTAQSVSVTSNTSWTVS